MTPTGRDLKGGRAGRVWWPLAGLLLILSAPFLLTEFYLDLLGVMLIRGLLALSFNLPYGFGGRLSFGHGAFLGTGAYVIGILLTRTEVPFPVAFLAAVVGSVLVAAFVGYFCVRFLSFYFSIMTLAFSQLLFLVVDKWYAVTGGDDGIQRIFPPDAISGITAQYYYVLVLSSAAALALWWVVRSPYGSALRAIRDNRRRAEFIGIDVSRYEWAAFVISGAFAGVAGALLAPFNRSISPYLFYWTKSAEPVFMTVLGGPYLFWGPLLGAAIFSILESTIPDLLFEAWPLVLGTILVSVVLFFPEGVAGVLLKSKNSDQREHEP